MYDALRSSGEDDATAIPTGKKNFWEVKQTAGFVPIEMRVLMALRQLATGATSLEIGLMFNVGEATARRFFWILLLTFLVIVLMNG